MAVDRDGSVAGGLALWRRRHADHARLTSGLAGYRVRQVLIVDPDDVWVLEEWPGVRLTLVTCYPFRYVGRAPQRFIVQAERLDF